jgi:CubicO group peptidase (beta-lactamase class C family)
LINLKQQFLIAEVTNRIFKPLGMGNTFFSPPKESLDRIATLYRPSVDSSGLEAFDTPDLFRFPHPEEGLFSTALDLDKWMQVLLNKGIYNGTRILTEKSIMEMTKIQIGELETGFTDGMSFGLGFGIVHNP